MRCAQFVTAFLLAFEFAFLPNADWYIVISYPMSNWCTLSVVNAARSRGYTGGIRSVMSKRIVVGDSRPGALAC